MFWQRLFATKSLEQLKSEMEQDEGRLRRVLGPIGLTSLGVGAIIGAGIFVMTGRAAANDAGPAILLSLAVAGVGCALAALCYAEFASLAPVAGSAYTYAYATLGELLAWIIGWDLILEYAMSCATVAASWSEYLNELLEIVFGKGWRVPDFLCHDPFSTPGAWFNLPAVLILALTTSILVIGIKESATSNTALVLVKLGVVLFVIFVGAGFVSSVNWTGIPPEERKTAEQIEISSKAEDLAKLEDALLSAAREWAAFRFGPSFHVDQAAFEKLQKAKVPEAVVKALAPLNNQDFKDQASFLKALEQHLSAEQRDAYQDAILDITRLPSADRVTVEAALGKKDSLAVPAESDLEGRTKLLVNQSLAVFMLPRIAEIRKELEAKGELTPAAKERLDKVAAEHEKYLPRTEEERRRIDSVLAEAREEAPKKAVKKWGLLGSLGFKGALESIDDSTRNNFMPYGLSGLMLGAAIVFFAFIGFDSLSTHSEEAVNPQRDVPLGIIASLLICTFLYIGVAGVITGMVPYPYIDTKAAVAAAFRVKAAETNSSLLHASAGLIATGALAGMTSVLLITFLSQARIFLAMARDHLLPPAVFGAVHHRFKTPHISTMLTGGIICVVGAFTPILILEEMVNIGTLFAFVIVCAAVLLLRIRRPDAHRPFRCPAVYVVAPLGILVNTTMMLFLPIETWLRLVVWLVIGLGIYFAYGYWQSSLGKSKAKMEAR